MEGSNRVRVTRDGLVVSLRAIQQGKVNMSISYEEERGNYESYGNERIYILVNPLQIG